MSGEASKRIMESALSEIAFTDSIPFDTNLCPKVKILSISKLFADTIYRVQENKSISEQYLL
jgi:ribose-phosphate pyrophosphokinase